MPFCSCSPVQVLPGTLLQRELGNLYCGSLYCGLVSLICERANELVLHIILFSDTPWCNVLLLSLSGEQVDNRILMFSYGSGLASSMFSLRVVAPVTFLAEKLNIRARLAQRIVVSPAEFSQVLIGCSLNDAFFSYCFFCLNEMV